MEEESYKTTAQKLQEKITNQRKPEDKILSAFVKLNEIYEDNEEECSLNFLREFAFSLEILAGSVEAYIYYEEEEKEEETKKTKKK